MSEQYEEQLKRIREMLASKLESIVTEPPTPDGVKPKEVSAYLRRVSRKRWQSTRWSYLGVVLGSVIWFIWKLDDPAALASRQKHTILSKLYMLTFAYSVGFSLWRFFTPPPDQVG